MSLQLLYEQSQARFGYDFVIRKRVLKRIWAVIGAHLQAAQERVLAEKASHSA